MLILSHSLWGRWDALSRWWRRTLIFHNGITLWLLFFGNKTSSHPCLLMVYRVGERIMTFCYFPATLWLYHGLTHWLFLSFYSVRIPFRHIDGAPSKSLLTHADGETGQRVNPWSILHSSFPSYRGSLSAPVPSHGLSTDFPSTPFLFLFSAWKNTKYKTFPEILYFPFWFRKFFRFPLANIYILLLKMLNQEKLFSGLPYII